MANQRNGHLYAQANYDTFKLSANNRCTSDLMKGNYP